MPVPSLGRGERINTNDAEGSLKHVKFCKLTAAKKQTGLGRSSLKRKPEADDASGGLLSDG